MLISVKIKLNCLTYAAAEVGLYLHVKEREYYAIQNKLYDETEHSISKLA